jgi:hypothetical protein
MSLNLNWPASGVQSIKITGSFDNWQQSCSPHLIDATYVYSLDSSLLTDDIVFKFIVNGDWVTLDEYPVKWDNGVANNYIPLDSIDKYITGSTVNKSHGVSSGKSVESCNTGFNSATTSGDKSIAGDFEDDELAKTANATSPLSNVANSPGKTTSGAVGLASSHSHRSSMGSNHLPIPDVYDESVDTDDIDTTKGSLPLQSPSSHQHKELGSSHGHIPIPHAYDESVDTEDIDTTKGSLPLNVPHHKSDTAGGVSGSSKGTDTVSYEDDSFKSSSSFPIDVSQPSSKSSNLKSKVPNVAGDVEVEDSFVSAKSSGLQNVDVLSNESGQLVDKTSQDSSFAGVSVSEPESHFETISREKPLATKDDDELKNDDFKNETFKNNELNNDGLAQSQSTLKKIQIPGSFDPQSPQKSDSTTKTTTGLVLRFKSLFK